MSTSTALPQIDETLLATTRYLQALTVLDVQRQTARGPLISYIDLTQGKRAIVGLVTGNHTIAEGKNE